MSNINAKHVKKLLIKRAPDAHKGDFGKVLIFAGSPGMAGAAVHAGRAALRSGAGIVKFLLPELNSPLYTVLQTTVPDAMCSFANESPDYSDYSAIAAGPGLGKSDTSRSILTDILRACESVLVLDADALNMIAEDAALADQVINSKAEIIMTPHIGEAKRLLGDDSAIDTPKKREIAARSIADKYHCICVLKGAGTVVCGEEIMINTTGNPGMATGGAGDVLTGLIAGLAAQGYAPYDAACMGVFLHGLAGDIVKDEYGEESIIASDLANCIPYAFKSVRHS